MNPQIPITNLNMLFFFFFFFPLFFLWGRRKDLLLLAASKEKTRDLSQSSVSLNALPLLLLPF